MRLDDPLFAVGVNQNHRPPRARVHVLVSPTAPHPAARTLAEVRR